MSHNTYRGKTENCRSIERRRVDGTILYYPSGFYDHG